MMSSRLRFVGAGLLALIAASPACATQFDFDFSGNGFFGGTLAGTGVLTTDDTSFINPANGYTAQTVTGISGTFNGSQITGLAPGFFGANDLFYLTGPFFVDGNGLSFTTAAGISANLFVTNDTSYRVNTQGAGLLTGLVTASATAAAPAAVPEPATWAMMLIGFGAIGCSMRFARKKQRVRAATA
jgi:hypothetical protein